METGMPPPDTPGSASDANPGQAIQDASQKRKRQPRNSACQSCSSLKMKCIASPVPGICERCNRMGRQCVVAAPKPRKRRSTSGLMSEGEAAASHSTSGMVEREAREAERPPVVRSTSGLSESDATRVPVSHLLSSTPESYTLPVTASYDRRVPQTSLPAQQPPTGVPRETVITQADPPPGTSHFQSLFKDKLGIGSIQLPSPDLLHGINYYTVQDCLAAWQSMQKASVFVQLPPDWDFWRLVSERPITFLAICAVTMRNQHDKQDRMYRLLKHVLAEKHGTGCKATIDEASALLVHLMWSQHATIEHSFIRELYQLAAVAVELCFNRPAASAVQQWQDQELKRTLFGCYYLCSSLTCNESLRPNPFPWNDHLEIMLKEEWRPPSESVVRTQTSLLELARSMDELTATLRERLSPFTRDPVVGMYISTAAYHLESLTGKYPNLASNPAFRARQVQLHAIPLRNDNALSESQIVNLGTSIREHLEAVLSMPQPYMPHMTIVDWTALLATLALIIQIRVLPGQGAFQNLFQPIRLLDALMFRIRDANYREQNNKLVGWFINLAEAMKAKLNGNRVPAPIQPLQGPIGYRPVNQGQSPLVPQTAGSSLAPSRRPSAAAVDPMRAFGPELLEDVFWEKLLNA